MELHGANIVEVAVEREEAAVGLVVPHLDFVVITSGDEERLGGVEVDSADGPVVLVEAVEEGAHAVVPHLDHPAVEARQDPWPPRVEGQALDPVALGLELGEHLPCSPGDDQSAGESEENRGGLEEDLPSEVAGGSASGAGDAEEEGRRRGEIWERISIFR
jgi:hypothetical protein